jgi:signal transduction histidine kinase
LLAQVRTELHAAVDELSDLARGIRPPALTNGGLAHAVPALAARAGLPVTTVVTVGRLPPAEEAALYFVCAEALANVSKHARASEVHIEIREQDGLVTALVTDDGVGGADRTGSGIQGLVDRVHAVGGTLDVEDHHPRGTRLAARLPVRLPTRSDTVEGNPT